MPVKGETKSTIYKETFTYDGDTASRIANVFSKEEIESLDKTAKTRIDVFCNPDKVIISSTTSTLLASVKHSIEKMAETVQRKVITVSDELEKSAINVYLGKHAVKGLKVATSNPLEACVYRIYAHPSKQYEFNQLCHGIMLKEYKKYQTVALQPSAAKYVHKGKVRDIAPAIGNKQLAKSVSFKPDSKSEITELSGKNTTNRYSKQECRNGEKITQKTTPDRKSTLGDEMCIRTWNINTIEHTQISREDHPASVPNEAQIKTFERTILLPSLTVRLLQENITRVHVDAVVNIANEKLSNDAGIAKVLSEYGGAPFDKACEDLIAKGKEIPVTQTCVTTAGNLANCRWVIHAVGPTWGDYREKEACLDHLCETVKNVFREACRKQFTSVAMPPISSGLQGVPNEACAAMYVKAFTEFTSDEMTSVSSLKQFTIIDMKDEILKIAEDFYLQVYAKSSPVTSKQVLRVYGLPHVDPSVKDNADIHKFFNLIEKLA